MKVAILDNGVNTDIIRIPKNIFRYKVLLDGTFVNNCRREHGINHATICSAIMLEKFKECFLYDIKVLDEFGNGNSVQLCNALEWCFTKEIEIIHMSLGTKNYHDIYQIEPIIDKLLAKKVIIIAAHSNSRIRSFPSLKKGVFSIHGIDKKDDTYSLYLSTNSNLFLENSFLVPYKRHIETKIGKIAIPKSNSFAAPILTAKVMELLNKKRYNSYEILELLKQQSKKIDYPLKKYATLKRNNNLIEHPVVYFSATLKSECVALYKKFRNNGFLVELISYWEDGHTIPYFFFQQDGTVTIDDDLLYTLETLYNINILLLCISKEWVTIMQGIIDVEISKDDYFYYMYYKDKVITKKNIDDIYEQIFMFFDTK